MPKQISMDRMYIDIAGRVAMESHGVRAKVGCVIVKDDNIISMGWNGTPRGDDNVCETELPDGKLITKPEVLHSESNALMKLVSGEGATSKDSTLYVTMSPCFECAKLIKQAKIVRVVYLEKYRDTSGIDFLSSRGVQVDCIEDMT